MSTARVTSKGQITIPIDVRTAMRLEPGSRLTFVPTTSGGYEIHRQAASIRDLKGAVRAPVVPVTLEQMDAAIAEGAAASMAAGAAASMAARAAAANEAP